VNFIRAKSPAITTAAALTAFNLVLVFLVLYLSGEMSHLWILFPLAIIMFILSFIVVSYFIEKLFYNKLKAIYKNILRLKTRSAVSTQMNVRDNDIFIEINNQLNNWQTEQQIEIEELKKAEVYRREFLGNVSHELKTPIFSAQGYLHTLIDGGIEDEDINMLYLQKSSKSLDRLIAIVEDLESISKLEAGEMHLEMRIFDIRDLVKEVFESLELKAKEKNISLQQKENANTQIYVSADKERIRQVLVNLIENSIKYGKNDGETTVQYYLNNPEVSIEIKDNGIGIEQQYLPRLFERFFRVDKSRSRDIGGTGLGLAIVKHIIEAHKQSITVDSTPGKGTTFSFGLKKSK